jgi:hypothetical protein
VFRCRCPRQQHPNDFGQSGRPPAGIQVILYLERTIFLEIVPCVLLHANPLHRLALLQTALRPPPTHARTDRCVTPAHHHHPRSYIVHAAACSGPPIIHQHQRPWDIPPRLALLFYKQELLVCPTFSVGLVSWCDCVIAHACEQGIRALAHHAAVARAHRC